MKSEPNVHPINLKLSESRLNKLRAKQVHETMKQGKSVSLQRILAQLIDEMVVNEPSEWQLLMSHVRQVVESQPSSSMSIEQFEAHQEKIRNIKRSDYMGAAKYAYPISINTFNEVE